LRFFILFEKIQKKMKYLKKILTNITIGGTWWKRKHCIPSISDPRIRVVVNGYDLSMPPEKELIIIGGWHSTAS
jgi:hypothetical protein